VLEDVAAEGVAVHAEDGTVPSVPTPEPTASRPELPGYGLPPADEGSGLLPFTWAEDRLSASRSYWIATSRPGGRPHLTPVWGIWQDGAVLFSCGRDSVKSRSLAVNDAIVVATDDPDVAVVVEGRAQLLDPSDRRFATFNAAYLAKYEVDVAAMGEPVYRVTPTKVFGFAEADFVGSATRWTFPASP
jgi:hypothetical protein